MNQALPVHNMNHCSRLAQRIDWW